MASHDPQRRRSLRLAAAALAWSLALIPAAFYAPAYHGERSSSTGAIIHTSATLVHVNGDWVLIVVAVPALLSAVVWIALAHRERSRVASLVASATVVVLGAFNMLAILSIGIFIVPATAALAWAVWRNPAATASPATAHPPPATA